MGEGFGPFGFVGKVTEGFNQGVDRQRQDNQREAELQANRDTKIFEALANSDDPEVRSAAVTGLLTGNHPARAFDKFFGKVGEHPAHEQIRSLLGAGHEGLPGAQEGARRTAKATTQGRDEGVFAGADSANVPLTPDQRTQTFMGMHGAAQARPKFSKGTLFFADGTSAAGFADEVNRAYYDDDNNQRTDVIRFSASGSIPSAGGFTGRNITGGDAPTVKSFREQFPQYASHVAGRRDNDVVTFRQNKDGTLDTITVTEAPPGPPGVVPNIYPTANGPVGVGRAGVEVPLPKSIQGAGRATTQPEKLNGLRQAAASILQGIRAEPKAQGLLGVDPTDLEAWRKERDAAAVVAGFRNWDDLQTQIGAASRGVGEATPPPRAPEQGAAPGGGGPPAAPGGGGRGAAGGRDPVVDSILKELGR